MKKAAGLLCLTAALAFGQGIDLSAWDKLGAKAKESSVVTLSPETLGLATSALSDNSADGKQLKDVVSKLKGVIIRSYEFSDRNAYTKADVDVVRKQLGGPGWTKIIDVKDSDETVEIWFHKGEAGAGGLTILAAEPKELTFVHIDGPADLGSLMKASKALKGSNLEGLTGGKSTTRKGGSAKDGKEEDDDEN